jgi:alkylation response protein AidB-like acyl-CoA dehydrogenase
MSLQLTKAQKAIIKAATEFAKGEFDKETALDLDQNARFPEKIWKKATELGFIGIHLPEDVGGSGLSMTELMLITETFSRYDSTLGAAIMLANVGADWISAFAGKSLQTEYLMPLLEGEMISGSIYPIALAEMETDLQMARAFLNVR